MPMDTMLTFHCPLNSSKPNTIPMPLPSYTRCFFTIPSLYLNFNCNLLFLYSTTAIPATLLYPLAHTDTDAFPLFFLPTYPPTLPCPYCHPSFYTRICILVKNNKMDYCNFILSNLKIYQRECLKIYIS
jgi:hypothetical protein